jgi:hypothetical protein
MIAEEPGVVHYVTIHLGDNEWTNELMEEVAKEYFDAHPELDPLEIEVSEHAGWRLSYLRDMTIVGTANDMAQLSCAARAHNQKFYHWRRQYVESIRRPKASCKNCGNDKEVRGGGLCQRCFAIAKGWDK